jgi:hypothetical protein
LPTLLIPLVGLAVDATVARLVQAKLQAAVDGAALGAGRLLGTTADPETAALEFLKANFRTDGSAGSWGADNLGHDIHYTPGVTKRIDINASADVPLLFMRILGKSKATVTAAGSATRTDSRVMIVLDRSPSMDQDDKTGSGNTVFTDAKNYAAGFVQKFTSSSDELGLVVLDSSGFVAYPQSNPGWDGTTTSTSTGGPKSGFLDSTDAHNLLNQLTAMQAVPNATPSTSSPYAGFTATSDSLWVAYTELQKTHLRDLKQDGVDYRMNSIVLLTDGLPQSVSVWVNNQNDNPNTTPNNVIKTASGCTNKANYGSTTRMIGYVGVMRPFSSNGPMGLYQLASMDPDSTHTTAWMLAAKPSGAGKLVAPAASLMGGCSAFNKPQYLYDSTNYLANTSNTDLANIPTIDAWGNSMNGFAYKTASDFVDQNGNSTTNQLSTNLTYDRTQVTSGDHWSLAMWNAVDSCAKRIRQDANKSNRTPTDLNNMAVTIYVIGYSGNGGVDQGLLRRVANDQLSSSYDSTQPRGLYVPAGNPTALQNAFNTIATAILRLAK